MKLIPTLLFVCFSVLSIPSYSQTTIFFQGFEGSCNDNWGQTGAVANNEIFKTGANSGRIGRCGENFICTFNSVNITGYSGVQLKIYHSVRGGSGPGMDTREGVVIQVELNGSGTWTTIGQAGGNGDTQWDWSTIGGVANTCSAPNTYTMPNPLTYSVPGGTTSFRFRVITIHRGNASAGAPCPAGCTSTAATCCTNFSNDMASANPPGKLYDRGDEGFFIDDVSLTTTTAITSVNWTGQVNTNWFCAMNWSPAIVPTPTINATFSTDNAASNNDIVLLTGPVAECNNLNIIGGSANNYAIKGENGATKTLRVYGNLTLNGQDGLDFSDGTTGTPDGTIELKGNWDNQIGEPNFKQGESTVIFNGTGAQNITITGTGPEIFYNFTVNKTSGSVTLNDNIEVCGSSTDALADRAGVLTLTSGNILTGSNYIYAVNPAVSGVSGGSASSFVDGNFRRQTNTANLYDFATGDGTRYMRAGVRPSNTSVNVVEVDAQNTGYGIYTPLESTLYDVSHLRWWDISRISGTSPVAVRLYWLGTPASEGITNTNDLVVAHYSNRDHSGTTGTLQWWNRGRSVANSSGLVNNGYVEASETVGTFSPFTISTLTPVNPLPVELVSFNAECKNSSVLLKWSTVSEINNDHFEIEGSKDAIHYTFLGDVQGAGNSNTLLSYEYSFLNSERNSYFRLVQYDHNGDNKIYDPVYVSCEPGNELFVSVTSNTIQVIWPQPDSETSWLITDISGKVLINGSSKGVSVIQMSTASGGIYILQGTNSVTGEVYYKKFLKL